MRQGDPMSPVPFNLVMQRALRDTRIILDKRKYRTLTGAGFGKDPLKLCTFAFVRRGQVRVPIDFAADIIEENKSLRMLGTVRDLFYPTGTEVENRIATRW